MLAGERKVAQLVAIVPCIPLAKPGKRATGRNCFVPKSPTRKPTRGKKRERASGKHMQIGEHKPITVSSYRALAEAGRASRQVGKLWRQGMCSRS